MMIRIFSLAALLMVAWSSSAFASHYLLMDVSFFTEAETTILQKQKILATEEFLAESSTPKKRKALTAATGLPAERILELSQLVDLLQIRGVGPKMALLFRAAGVETLKDLSKAKVDLLMAKLKEVNRTKHISEVLPSADLVESWIRAASKPDVPYRR